MKLQDDRPLAGMLEGNQYIHIYSERPTRDQRRHRLRRIRDADLMTIDYVLLWPTLTLFDRRAL
jgi:hypothetical protein